MTRPPDESWLACPPGELSRLVARRRSRRRAQVIGVSGLALLALLASQHWFASSLPSWAHPFEPNYGGIVCSAVRPQVDDYVQGRLDAATAGRIEAHVALCPSCRAQVDEARLRPRVSRQGLAADDLAMNLNAGR